jgi:DNA-binding transcriptional MocR family regulator
VLALAAAQGTTLIADETIGELDIDSSERMLPFAAYGHVDTQAILVGSVGKTVWGGVRIGWIRADRPLIQRLVRNRSAGDLGNPVLEQLIAPDATSSPRSSHRSCRSGRCRVPPAGSPRG